LLLDIVENPFFDKPELARERDALLAEQIKRRDDEYARSVELLLASIYPQHPYGLPRYGRAEVIKALTEEKLEAWHVKTIKRQLPLVIVVGDTDGSALISRIFSDGFKRNELDKTMKVNLPPLTAPPEEQVEQRSRRVTAQAIGFRGPAGESADYLPLRMLGHLTATGRFADELRAKQIISDRLIVRPDPRLASGAFFAFITTAPGDEQRALEVLRTEVAKLSQAPPSDEEFERGRNATIGAYAIALQAHPQRAMEYARAVVFNRKPSDVEAQPDLIRSVRKADLRRVAEAVVKISQIGRGVVRGQ
jgi:predicted Zn-dependent peptidase